MNIREAILKAADHIEAHPREFDFNSSRKPECGTPGCALGWIGFYLQADESDGSYMLGVARACRIPKAAPACGYINEDGEFYVRMNTLYGDARWIGSADRCAATLRLYADKYHPAPKLGIPASVRAIFDSAAEERGGVFADYDYCDSKAPLLEGDSRE